MIQLNVAIVGAGIGGLATAIALRRAGHVVTLFEKMPVLSEIGAGISLTPNALRIFEQWGIMDMLEARACTHKHTIIRSYSDGDILSMIPNLDATIGCADMTVHRADLQQVLLIKAKELGAELHLNADIIDLVSDSARKPIIKFSNREDFEADAILGADGERSLARSLLEKGPLPFEDSGYHVFRAVVPTAKIRSQDELKHLIETPNRQFWLGPQGNAFIYPIQRGELLNIVTTREHPVRDSPQVRPHPTSKQEVLQSYQGWDPVLLKLLSLSDSFLKWDLLEGEMPDQWRFQCGKIALIGDAAHAILPFAGQGACMAFEDAATIGVLLSQVQDVSDIPKALEVFEILRRPRVRAVKMLCRRLGHIYDVDDGPEQRERDEQLKKGVPFPGHPMFVEDPVVTEWLIEYRAVEEAQKAWAEYQGQLPRATLAVH